MDDGAAMVALVSVDSNGPGGTGGRAYASVAYEPVYCAALFQPLLHDDGQQQRYDWLCRRHTCTSD